jgi:hypothetical protein
MQFIHCKKVNQKLVNDKNKERWAISFGLNNN